jgi:hypothetical protein
MHRKIRVSEGPDILWWGSKGEGTFTFKDVYRLVVGLPEIDMKREWKRIWKPRTWPKVGTFLWLVLN